MSISKKGVERIREHLSEGLEDLLDNNVDIKFLIQFFEYVATKLKDGTIK